MQTRTPSLIAAVALFLAPVFLRAQTATPTIPVGDISSAQTTVKGGTFPQLTWSVTVPQTITDVITVTPPGTVTPKKNLRMDVRLLGASVWAQAFDSNGNPTSGWYVPTEALVSVGTSAYNRFWYDIHTNINPNTVVYSQNVTANTPINFAGRYWWYGAWSTLYNSTNPAGQVVALVNGSVPPTSTPLYQQPTIESFILPYLDAQGKIKLGPRDVIYLIELTHTNKNDPGWDLQDLAFLVTFTEI